MSRPWRLLIVALVLVGASYGTRLIHRHYWHMEQFRTVAAGRLYVFDRLDRDLLTRFRSHFGQLWLVELRPDDTAEVDQRNGRLRKFEEDGLVIRHPLPLREGGVPTPEDLKDFLKLCSGTQPRTMILYEPPSDDPNRHTATRCLEAAFRYAAVGQTITDALDAAGLAGTAADAPCRQSIISSVGRR